MEIRFGAEFLIATVDAKSLWCNTFKALRGIDFESKILLANQIKI